MVWFNTVHCGLRHNSWIAQPINACKNRTCRHFTFQQIQWIILSHMGKKKLDWQFCENQNYQSSKFTSVLGLKGRITIRKWPGSKITLHYSYYITEERFRFFLKPIFQRLLLLSVVLAIPALYNKNFISVQFSSEKNSVMFK